MKPKEFSFKRSVISTAILTVAIMGSSDLAARDVAFKKKIDPGALQTQLKKAGFSVNFIDCSRDNCTIHMPDTEKKDPLPLVTKYIYVDHSLARKQELDAVRALYMKWQKGEITPSEKDDLLKQLSAYVLGITD